jgi:hypothetical protein
MTGMHVCNIDTPTSSVQKKTIVVTVGKKQNKLLTSCWFLLDPEDGGDMFLQNVICLPADYTAYIPENETLQMLISVFIIMNLYPWKLRERIFRDSL